MRQIKNNKPNLLDAFSDEQIICAAEKIKDKALLIDLPERSRALCNLSAMSSEFKTLIKHVKGKDAKALKTLSQLAAYNVNIGTKKDISKARALYCQMTDKAKDHTVQEALKILIEACDMVSTFTEAIVGADGYAWGSSDGVGDLLMIDMSELYALPVQWLHQELAD